MPSKWKLYIPEIIFFLFLSLLPLWWMRNGSLVFGHDSAFTLKTHEQVTNQFFAWNGNVNSGTDWPYQRAYLPMNIAESALHYLFPLSIAQRMIFVSWFFLMVVAMFLFVRELFPSAKERIIRVIASTFYVVNFFVFELWFIGDRPKFSFLVLLPLTFFIFQKLFSHRWKLRLGLLVFFFIILLFNCAGLPPLLGSYVIASALVFGVLSVKEIASKKLSGVLFVAKTAVGMMIVGFVSQAYWIIPFFAYVKTGYSSTVSAIGGIEGTIAWERMVSVNASISHLLRITGSPNWIGEYAYTYASGYLSHPILIALGFVPVLMTIIGVVLFWSIRKKQSVTWYLSFLLLFLAGIFLSAGTHRPTGVLYELLMRHIPGFAIFRSSYYKFMPFVIFSLSILFGIGVYQLSQRIRLLAKYGSVTLSAIIAGLLLYHAPIFLADPFRFSWGFSTLVTVPSYASDMARVVKNLPKESKIFLLPQLDSGYIGVAIDGYQWGYYSLETFPGLLLDRPVLSDVEGSREVIRAFYTALKNRDSVQVQYLSQLLGITHLLFRRDIQQSTTQMQLSVSDWEKIIDESPFIEKISEHGLWSLYQVSTPALVTSYLALTAINGPADTLSYALSFSSQHNDAITFGSIPERNIDTTITRASCIYCKRGEFDAFVTSINVSAYRVKEQQVGTIVSKKELTSYNDAAIDLGARIDMDLAFANRALAFPAFSSDSIRLYRTYMEDALIHVQKLENERKNSYAIRILGFLLAQQKFIKVQTALPDTSIEGFLDDSISVLQQQTYMSDPEQGTYRYLVTLPDSLDREELVIADTESTLWNVSVDGIVISSENARIGSGHHRLELKAKKIEDGLSIPAVFTIARKKTIEQGKQLLHSTKISPVEYRFTIPESDRQQVVFVPISYHPGWILIEGDPHWWDLLRQRFTPVDAQHLELFGFGNGWILQPSGQQTVTLYFLPQVFIVVGFTLSGVAIVVAVSCGLLMFRQSRTVQHQV